MLSRFISKPSHHHHRLISFLISSQPHPPPIHYPHLTIHSPLPPSFRHFIKHLSTNNKNTNNGNNIIDSLSGDSKNGDGDDFFKVGRPVRQAGLASENWVDQKDDDEDDLFKQVEGSFKEVSKRGLVNEDWVNVKDDDDEGFDLFKEAEVGVKEVPKRGVVDEDWVNEKEDDEGFDLFKEAEESVKAVGVDGEEDNWATADGFEQWDLDTEEKGEDVFGLGETEMSGGVGDEESEESKQEKLLREKEQKLLLEKEEKELSVVFNGPDRAFGDLVAKSGITEEMFESLIALKDLEGIQGLPPLSEIEDIRYEKNSRNSLRADIEREKQEEVANARVRQVDSKGRAYATGKRKCSIARVWIQPGEGKFVVNDKQFDVYFPMLEQRAALLRPFTETKTLGVWDVNCTVKGGGISGQVGAIRLGISRALQNWEPDLRPPLKEAGFLTRDSRVVERKKPGKAKARKSFQWVKR